MIDLDNIDWKILEILSCNGRVSKTQLALDIGLTPTPCLARIEKLEAAGIIRSYTTNIDTAAICAHIQILVAVKLDSHQADDFHVFEKEVECRNSVQWCWAVGGGLDYIMLVTARNIADYQTWIDSLLDRDIRLQRYFTYAVTKEVKRESFMGFIASMKTP